MQPTLGRIVHYVLSTEDVRGIVHQERRTPAGHIADGNPHTVGQVVAAVVVRVFGEDSASTSCNLQILLDSQATYWAPSRYEGTGPGTWSWPPRSTS